MLKISLVGDAELDARFRAMPSAIRNAIRKAIHEQTLALEGHVKADKLSGQVLHVRTGNLRASIHSTFSESSTAIKGKVASSGDVKYAAIHEFGGKTAAHVIEPNKASVLAFMMGGKQVFAKRVNHPGSTMPERSYLRSSLSDRRSQIENALQNAAHQGTHS